MPTRPPLSPRWLAPLLLALPLLLGGGFGCASGTPVEISSQPAEATLTVYNAKGKEIASGRSPIVPRLDLKDGQQYRVEATPLGEAAEFYESATARVDSNAVVRAGSDAKQGAFSIALPQRSSVMLPAWVPVYHPRDGWIALRTRLRSDQSVVETDGSEPREVLNLSEALSDLNREVRVDREGDRTKQDMPVKDIAGVWGLDVTGGDGSVSGPDDAEAIVSLFAAGRNVQLPLDDPEAARRVRRATADRKGDDVRLPSAVPSSYRHELREARLVAINPANGAKREVTDKRQADLEPAYMTVPDERTGSLYVLFSTNRDRENRSWIYRVPANRRGSFGPIDNFSDRVHGTTTPSHARDGAIAFSFVPVSATSLEDLEVRALLDGPGSPPSNIVGGSQPRISPQGGRIAYVNNNELWTNNTNVAAASQMTDLDGDAVIDRYAERSLSNQADRRRFDEFEKDWLIQAVAWPAWSPDGNYLCYSALTEDEEGRPNYDIWIISRAGGIPQRVTANGSADIYPRFGPDGRTLYFLSNRGLAWGVWRHDVSGKIETATMN